MSEGVQDTGNPVLDSVVNLAVGFALQPNVTFKLNDLQPLHDLVLEMAQKEPGGLKRRGEHGALNPRDQKKV